MSVLIPTMIGKHHLKLDMPGEFSNKVLQKCLTTTTAHYVDSFGYKDVPEFLQPENYLKTAEQTTEQNYNMIDGQINNTPTAAELEEKAKAGGQISLAEYAEALKTDKERGKPAKQEKPSIRAQLKAAKEQTPKKQARQKTQDLERS